MTLALEQAGSLFTGWMRSCLSCLVPNDACQGNQTEERGMCATNYVNVAVYLHTEYSLTYSRRRTGDDSMPYSTASGSSYETGGLR